MLFLENSSIIVSFSITERTSLSRVSKDNEEILSGSIDARFKMWTFRIALIDLSDFAEDMGIVKHNWSTNDGYFIEFTIVLIDDIVTSASFNSNLHMFISPNNSVLSIFKHFVKIFVLNNFYYRWIHCVVFVNLKKKL